ncbi:hypothetical protein M6B38_250885 [Iris pallida]|uniref:Uncharacterized protein n=1 Tax=Iris pallida TaxID=29817 RepID=A0AAX6IJV4_IRIPA|nr:hypothetical protein M6B38_250885 [Iris pallida]
MAGGHHPTTPRWSHLFGTTNNRRRATTVLDEEPRSGTSSTIDRVDFTASFLLGADDDELPS